jgi:hypothetical protein
LRQRRALVGGAASVPMATAIRSKVSAPHYHHSSACLLDLITCLGGRGIVVLLGQQMRGAADVTSFGAGEQGRGDG